MAWHRDDVVVGTAGEEVEPQGVQQEIVTAAPVHHIVPGVARDKVVTEHA